MDVIFSFFSTVKYNLFSVVVVRGGTRGSILRPLFKGERKRGQLSFLLAELLLLVMNGHAGHFKHIYGQSRRHHAVSNYRKRKSAKLRRPINICGC